MSYGGYQQYGSNPYGSNAEEERYGSSNPYGGTASYEETSNPYSSSNPYGEAASNPYGAQGGETYLASTGHQDVAAPARPQPTQATSDYSQTSNFSRPGGYSQTQAPPMPTVVPTQAVPLQTMPAQTFQTQSAQPVQPVQSSAIMSNQDFLARVEAVKSEIRELTGNIAEIGTIHQRVLGSPDNSSSAQLQNLVAQTQILNTRIKDQIKQLENDAAKSGRNQTKDSQIRTLKSNFKTQLDEYQNEELTYRQRYRDQIARQYKIVNPEATNQEIQDAANADWGDEGVFQTALRSNRTGAANSVLGAVRARHNDIQQINKTLIELNQLFQDLAEAVVLQEAPIIRTEEQTTTVLRDTEAGNTELKKAEDHARRARKLKWWCFWIVVLIIVILGLVLGLYFGLKCRNGC